MSQYLGDISAYALAVSQGYTGTEEEFAELMASYADVGQTAVDAKDAALAAKTAAQTAATTATNKATEATTAATTATTKAGEASTSASTATSAKDTAVSASQTATTKATEATTAAATATSAKTDAVAANTAAQSAKTAAQTAQTGAETAAASVSASAAQIATNTEDISQLKSEIADMQSDGVVPSAEQILSDKGITDSVPYHFRKTASDNSNREELEIVGGSIAWNQLVQKRTITDEKNGVIYTSTGDGLITASGTATADSYANLIPAVTVQGHKILLLGCPNGGTPTTYYVRDGYTANNYDFGNGLIVEAKANTICQINVKAGTTVSNLVFKPQMFDLTAMFGSTIADYIYQLEQTTAGAGVAFFKALFPNDYYPYNAGELLSVSGLSEHKMVGFNQWDEEVENGYIDPNTGAETADSSKIRMKNYMRVLPNATYYKKSPNAFWCVYFDENKNYVGHFNGDNNRTFTVPSNARYMRSGFEISYGTTYNHDICINLSDPAKNGTYEPYKAHSYPLDSTVELRGLFKLDANNNLYADGDTYDADGTVTRNTILRAYQNGDESLTNAITDGTNTVVYSANASTEQAQPYQHLQQCDPYGTEEYVSTGIVPIGHNSFYPENLRAKVEGLPWNFASLIAPTESAFVATRNYTTGSLFIVSNVLYKATSNIANGGTITPNTNCTATTLAEIISALA